MQLANIIPEYTLQEHPLLVVFVYLLRKVDPAPTKAMVRGTIVALRSYEVCEELDEVSKRTRLAQDVVLATVMRLADLDLVDYTLQDGLHRIRLKKVVLPRPESSQAANEPKDYDDCLFSDFVSDYLEYVKTNLSKKTLQNAARVMKLFGDFVGRKKLSQLSATDLEEYKRKRKGNVMDSTINIDVRTLKAAMNIAVDWGRLKSNPFRPVKLIRLTKKPIRPLTKEEFTQLCEKIEEPWIADTVRFAVLTGLRRGEIVNLRWKDVDLAEGQISIQSSEEYRVKHGKTRILPLSPDAVSILRRYEKPDGWVFVNGNGEHLNAEFVSKKVKKYMRELGFPEELHMHSLRATFASWGLKEGMPIYAVKNFLGHASVRTTETYASYDRDSLRQEVQKIALPPESEAKSMPDRISINSNKGP